MKKQLILLSLLAFVMPVICAENKTTFQKVKEATTGMIFPVTKIGVGALMIASVPYICYGQGMKEMREYYARTGDALIKNDSPYSGKEKLLIVGDRVLYHVPFAAALGAGTYLIIDGIKDIVHKVKEIKNS